jgi:hypothetical protein
MSPYKSHPVQFGRRTSSPSNSVASGWDLTEEATNSVWDTPNPNYTPLRTNNQPPAPIDTRQLNLEVLRIAKEIANKGPIARKIIVGLPTTFASRSRANARKALALHIEAKNIVEEALKGHNDYGSAHYQFNFARRQCEHRVPLYHYEAECSSCAPIERELSQIYLEHFPAIHRQFRGQNC